MVENYEDEDFFDEADLIQQTAAKYPITAKLNVVGIVLNILFLVAGVASSTIALQTGNIDIFGTVASILLLAAFPLLAASFIVGLLARWAGLASRFGEILALVNLLTLGYCVFAIITTVNGVPQ